MNNILEDQLKALNLAYNAALQVMFSQMEQNREIVNLIEEFLDHNPVDEDVEAFLYSILYRVKKI
jgi:hypothetical protein